MTYWILILIVYVILSYIAMFIFLCRNGVIKYYGAFPDYPLTGLAFLISPLSCITLPIFGLNKLMNGLGQFFEDTTLFCKKEK